MFRYEWLQVVPSSQEPVSRSTSSELVLESVAYTDQGDYVCQAVNVIGRSSHNIYLQGFKLSDQLTTK
jgi:hypothetical protein